MSASKLYLKQNAYIEPLINQWYAWGLLVAPHTLAMILQNLHLKIMQSYIKSPQIHANALKNPKMLGGPFIDLEGNQTAIVKELLEKTLAEQADMLAFADAIKEIETIMANEAKGHSLLPIYQKIPELLQGFIELGYDLNNQPSVRFIERLIYNSKFYDTSRQSVALSLVEDDNRAFALSTPRFPDDTHLHLNIPFESDAIDRLFSMRETPQSLEYVADIMPTDPQQRAFFESLFTDQAPELRGRDREELGDQVRVKYFGHAVLLFESKDVSILTDPVISYKIDDDSIPRYTYQDLPEVIDYVVITHGHQDHIMYETLLQLRHKIRHIVVPRCNGGTMQDPSLLLMLERAGFTNIIELDEMQSLEVPSGTITGLPFFGEHGELHIRSKLAYHIRLNGRSALCAADSNNLSPKLYDYITDALGPVDKTFIGMECDGAPMSWLYGPLLTKPLERRMDQSRRLDGSDSDRGMEMIKSLKSSDIYIYAMGQEPWLTFISSIKYTEKSKPIVESNKLIKACEDEGFAAERLFGCKSIIV